MAAMDRHRNPTLFEVLAVSPQSFEGQDPTAQTKIARQAYRRALLKHHPDRQRQQSNENAAATSDSSSTSSESPSQHFTVDQITEAYTVLSDAQERRKYTRTLRSQTKTTSSGSASTNPRRKRRSRASGLETVDLDHDLSWDGKRRLYYRACHGCGTARGFSLKEDEIEDENEEDDEIILECSGCETEMRVLVPALADDDDGQNGEQQSSGLATQQPHPVNQTTQSYGDAEPPKKSRGWGLRLGLGLGLSLGGGASGRAGR